MRVRRGRPAGGHAGVVTLLATSAVIVAVLYAAVNRTVPDFLDPT